MAPMLATPLCPREFPDSRRQRCSGWFKIAVNGHESRARRKRSVPCRAKEVSEPRAKSAIAATAGTRRLPSRRSSPANFCAEALYPRAQCEKYPSIHSTIKQAPCGQIIVVDDGYDLFLTVILYPELRLGGERLITSKETRKGAPSAEILVDSRRHRGHRTVGRREMSTWRSSKPPIRNLRTGMAKCKAL
jgi:hypothetical protein